jgi:spore germination protein KA
LVIIVAITGITAFAVPDFSLSFHIRVVRFAYIIVGYLAGFLGIAFCLIFHITILAHINSFGVSYLSPYAPISTDNGSRILLVPSMET